MKKIFLIAVAAVLALTVFTGCDNNVDKINEGVVLSWSIYPDNTKSETWDDLTTAWVKSKAISIDVTVAKDGFVRIQDQYWNNTESCKVYSDKSLSTEVTDWTNGYEGTLYFSTKELDGATTSGNLICFCGNNVTIWTATLESYDTLENRVETLEGYTLPGTEIDSVDFSKCKLANGGYGDVPEIDKNGYLIVKGAGNWQSSILTLPEKSNIFGKTVKIVAKTSYSDNLKDLKFTITDVNGGKSEITVDKSSNYASLSSDFTELSLPISNMWIAYGVASLADATKVAKIGFEPQGGNGTITIKSIKFE